MMTTPENDSSVCEPNLPEIHNEYDIKPEEHHYEAMQETIATHIELFASPTYDELLTYGEEDQPKPSGQEAQPQIKPPQSHQSKDQQKPPTQGPFQQINLIRQVTGKRNTPLRGDATSWPFDEIRSS